MIDPAEQIDLNPEPTVQPQSEPVDLSSQSTPPLPNTVAASRAYKTTNGVGRLVNKTFPEVYQDITSGNEPVLRKEAAAAADYQSWVHRQELLKNLTLQKGAPLSMDEVRNIMDTSKPIDPDTIIEKGYSQFHMVDSVTDANGNMGSTFLNDAQVQIPNTVEATKKKSTDLLTYNQYVLTKLQNAQGVEEDQSLIGKAADWAKTLATFGMYDEVKTRGWMESVPAISWAGLGSGANLYEQSVALYRLPFDQFKAKVDEVYDKLVADNPRMAVTWLHAMLGQSITEQTLGDLGTYINVATIPGAGIGTRALIKGVNAVKNGYKDVLEVAKNPNATKAEILNAAGDTQGGAAVQASSELNANIAGTSDLNKQGLEALPSGLRADQALVANGSWTSRRGERFKQEVVNRLNEQYNWFISKFTDLINDVPKVGRAQEITSSPVAMKKIIDWMKDRYTGPASSVADTAIVHYDSLSNTHWIEMHLLDEAGKEFKTEEQVRGWAAHNGVVLDTPQAYVDSVNQSIKDLEARLKEPRDIHGDVHEMNRYADMETKLQNLKIEAKEIADRGSAGFPIGQNGFGYYIKYLQPLRETEDIFRDLLGKTAESKLPDNWLGGYFNWLRTPKETLSNLENQMREVATHGPSRLLALFKESSKDIENLKGKWWLGKNQWRDWSRAIDFARQAKDAKGLPGKFFDTPQELEDWYMHYAKGGRLPDIQEIAAYFAFKRNVEAERALREMRTYALKARVGTEQHRFFTMDKDGKKVFSDFLEGISQKEFVPGTDDAVLVVSNRLGNERIHQANELAFRKKYEKEVKEGRMRVIRVYDPDLYPLKNFGKTGESRVRWVLTNNIETKPLSWENQVSRRGGGHFIYNYDYYIKQAKMAFDPVTKHWNYSGDTTVMPIANSALGNNVVKHLNAVSSLLKSGDEAAAKQYHVANNLPMDWDEHLSWYKPSRTPDGVEQPARLRMGEKFYMVPKNKLIVDLGKDLENRWGKLFKDRTRTGSDARQNMVEFTGERDAYEMHSIEDQGTRGNPLYAYEPSRLVDPMASHNRGLNRIIQSTFLDDIKISSVEHWIEEAKDLFKTSVSLQDLRHAPFYHFANPEFATGADPERVKQLMTARYQINQFIGMPSKVDTALHSIADKLVSSIYSNVGPQAAQKFYNFSQLPYIRNPLAFTRSVTFHLKMGLFSIPQFFMQFTTAANVMAITGPRNIPAILSATLLHQLTKMNSHPNILAHFDGIASKMGWRPGEFTEFRDLLIRSGFQNIGGEHAFLDTPWSAKFTKNLGQTVLDWGEAPFRAGASNTRIAAFAAAYKEFRSGAFEGGRTIKQLLSGKEGTIYRRGSIAGKITEEDFRSILARAADLDHNMSRAANSAVHTGVMSPFGQFTAYSLRLMELMTGKRLTAAEKARLFGVSSLLYGVPAGGIGLYGFPLGDYMRQKAQEQLGYIPGDNFISTVFNEGLPSEIMKVITGDTYNIQKFGAKGFEPTANILSADKTFWDVLGGASFGTVANMFANSSSIRNWAVSTLRGDNDQYPLTFDDITGWALKESTTYNAFARALIANNIGKWTTKNGSWLGDVSKKEAWLQTLFGVVRQDIADITISSSALKQREAFDKQTEHEFLKVVNLAALSQEQGNLDEARRYLMQAKALIGPLRDYPVEKRGHLLARAFQQRQSILDKLDWELNMRDVPPSQEPIRTQMYYRKQEIRQGK